MSTCTLTRPTMELSEALRYLKRNNVFLCWTENGIDLWTCGRKMPQPLRRSIYKHREQIVSRMRSSHPSVCPARDLHAFEWVLFRETGREVCLMCAQLAGKDVSLT